MACLVRFSEMGKIAVSAGLRRLCALTFLCLFAGWLGFSQAFALQATRVPPGSQVIDLMPRVERSSEESETLQISTAPGSDGIVRRIQVRSRDPGTRASWIAFALTNDTDEQIDRLLVAPHFRLSGSGVTSPDLGSRRIVSITASQGFSPEREESSDADVFLITLDPGSTVTFVAELASPNLPQLLLWDQDAYREKQNALTLYRGIVIGIAALLALFLSVVFVVKGALIFPAAAALGWTVLAYACIDFGFLDRIFGLEPGANAIYRAGAEAVLSATLLAFLFAYLNLNRWQIRYARLGLAWLAFLALLIGLAVINPSLAAGIARISIVAVAFISLILVLYLSTHGYDRAVMLIPTWFLLLAWVTAAGFTVMGYIDNEIVAPALIGGLVLIVMLIGFTVMQHAFSGGIFSDDLGRDGARRALALSGSGDAVFDWDVLTDRVYVGGDIEHSLGFRRGSLEGPAASWLSVIHPHDRDRTTTIFDTVLERRAGRISQDFRIRAENGQYHWFHLKARPVIGSDGEIIRVIGTMADVTEQKTAEDRLLHDAVHDRLTGLPNRTLLIDRIDAGLAMMRSDASLRPTVISIDIDRFKQINDAIGLPAGDAILITIARRLSRLLRAQDTLARLSGDQFCMVLLSLRETDAITAFADTVRRTLATPITFKDREIFLTASIGITLVDPQPATTREDVLRDAELAMTHAKRGGGDRIQVFRSSMRLAGNDRLLLESDLRRALERGEMRVFFQPIVRLEDRTIAGFEALARWDHPTLGRIAPKDFIPIAEETGLINELGLFVLDNAARELSLWQQALEVDPPIFASVNVSSRQLLGHDLIQEVKAVLARYTIQPGSLKLELTESLVMENPEYAAQVLTRLRALGAGLSLDDFGTGYSSLAYLERFPFDSLKIDQSFVRENRKGTRSVMLRSIITLANDLGLSTVAEGTETDSDTVELYQLGCEYAQGFIFGEPMSAEAARRLIGANPDFKAAS